MQECTLTEYNIERIRKYMEKRKRRKWGKFIRYAERKRLASQRPRYKGRFIKVNK